MKNRILFICIYLLLTTCLGFSQKIQIVQKNEVYHISVSSGTAQILHSPEEGLWSISTSWEGWPSNWHHVNPVSLDTLNQWIELKGKLLLPEGEWWLKDLYKKESGKIKCVRRWEWKGNTTLDHVTLAIRWILPFDKIKPYLPGILFNGNPSGEKNGPNDVAWYHGKDGDEAIFEEHRYPMPFAFAETEYKQSFVGAALHTLPCPIKQGNLYDQWWSLGIKTESRHSELEILSGPIAYNRIKNRAKALQNGSLPYEKTYLKIAPGTIIEKTFYLEVFDISQKGSGFQQPVHTSINLFKPFYTNDLPLYNDIIRSKYFFAQSRWIESNDFAGFNMFPSFKRPQIVTGWAGQCEAPGFALQVLANKLNDPKVWSYVQRSLNHICTSPLDQDGFCVIYDIGKKSWEGKDPVSQGQTMYSISLAIQEGRKNKKVDTKAWETFLLKASALFAKKILDPAWKPVNTAESFFIAPLLVSYKLFNKKEFKDAALKAADYYAVRHLSMDEPYWGGTLDATCEDKEGAWGAFQGFLTAYELTHHPMYLKYARHACDVILSYTVVWDITLPAGRLSDHAFKSRGWTGVSAQNQHLDVYGVLIAPSIYKLGMYLKDESLKKLAKTMFLSCGQLIDASGSQGEQIQHTNFAQQGEMIDITKLRGGYSEQWTVFWITAHFLNAAAQFEQMNVKF